MALQIPINPKSTHLQPHMVLKTRRSSYNFCHQLTTMSTENIYAIMTLVNLYHSDVLANVWPEPL